MRYPILLCLFFCSNLSLPALDAYRTDPFTSNQGLLGERIVAVHRQTQGPLWILTWDQIYTFDGKAFRFQTMPVPLKAGRFLDLYEDDGYLYLICEHALHRYDLSVYPAAFEEVAYFGRNRVGSYARSGDGFWFGTDFGVFRMNGDGSIVDGQSLGFPSGEVVKLLENPTGDLWVAFRFNGVVRLAAGSVEARSFTIADGLPHTTIADIYWDQSGLLVATYGGLARFADNRFIADPDAFELPVKRVRSVYRDRAGRLWITASREGVWVIENGKQHHFIEDNIGVGTLFAETKDGKVWLGSKGGLHYYENGAVHKVSETESWLSTLVTDLAADGNRVWAGTAGGLMRVEPMLFQTLTLHDTNRLSGEERRRMMVRDEAGVVWFLGESAIFAWDGNRLLEWNRSKLGEAFAEPTLLEVGPRGKIWVGTSKGMWKGHLDGFERVGGDFQQGVSRILFNGKGRLLLITDHGQAYVGSRNENALVFKQVADDVSSAAYNSEDGFWLNIKNHIYPLDPDGVLGEQALFEIGPEQTYYLTDDQVWWYGSPEGLVRQQGDQVRIYKDLFPDAERPLFLSARRASDGSLWFVFGFKRSASVMSAAPPLGLVHVVDDELEVFPRGEAGLNYLGSLRRDGSGRLWMVTDAGLVNLEDAGFQSFSVADGLVSSSIVCLDGDLEHGLWVGGNGGLDLIRDGLIYGYTAEDGLLPGVINDVVLDKVGMPLIRTRSGVQRPRVFAQEAPLVISLDLYDDGKLLQGPGPHRIEDSGKDLRLKINSIYLGHHADKTKYTYTLLGKESHSLGDNNQVQLGSLRFGEHLITARAVGPGLVPSLPSEPVVLIIPPPIYMQPWFIAAGPLLVALFGFLFYRIRLRAKLKRQHMESELANARLIQMSLMPEQPPYLKGLEMMGFCRPAKEVGGDYYDHFWLDDYQKEMGMVVMDVTGKSMKAAMISVVGGALVAAQSGMNRSPSQILERINGPLFRKTARSIFVTSGFIGLELDSGNMRFCCAGHDDPIVIREGRRVELEKPERRDLALAVKENWSFYERHFQCRPGDLVLLYTDGLTEARNREGLFFGEERLVAFLEKQQGPVADIVEGIMEEVDLFVDGAEAHDDLTLILFRYKGDGMS